MREYTTVDDVKNLSRVNPQKIGLDPDTEADKLNIILAEWIREATALINDYTGNPLSESDVTEQNTKYYLYKNVATRIVANMCALSSAYKSHSVVKVNDWTIRTIPSEIFPDIMKKELSDWKLESNNNSTGFGILTVTGEDIIE